MTDRELLEAAAKAAGIEHVTPMMIKWGQWDPLTDDGDALRLAVKLRLDVEWLDADTVFVSSAQHVANNDHYAATRRAIVRAAAEIGRQVRFPQDATPAS